MNVLFTDCMTVYNFYISQETGEEHWQRTEIRGVQWRHGKKSTSVKSGMITEIMAESITVDFSRDYGNKKYVPSEVFASLGDQERQSVWTLNESEHMDVVVQGSCNIEIGEEYRIKNLLNSTMCAGIVRMVTDNRNRPRLKQIRLEAARS